MFRRHIWAVLLALAGAGATIAASGTEDTTALAKKAWAITDVVLDHHLAPPTRPEMLATAVQAVLQKTGAKPPANLRERLTQASDASQLAAILKDVWPAEAKFDWLSEVFVESLFPTKTGPGDRLLEARELEPTPAERRVQEQVAQNRYVGTGIQVRAHDAGYPMIVLAFAGGPARRAGARANDLVLDVDGVSMKGKSVQDFVTAARGDEGTDVTFVVRQPNETETRMLKMTRAVVPFDTALGYRRAGETAWQYRPDLASPIAYVRIGALNVSTLHDLRKLEPKFQAEGVKAVVLDLRTAVGDIPNTQLVADGLLDGGVLWRVRWHNGDVTEPQADRDCLFRGWPMAVLVNEGTQSTGTVLLAAALQDNHRAVVIGGPTAAVGPMRAILRLPENQGAMLLTVGFYQRSSAAADGANKPWSVQPDLRVAQDDQSREEVIAWGRAQDSPDAPLTNGDPPNDAPLTKALQVLKATLNNGGGR